MSLPPIDLSKLIKLLKAEGKTELTSVRNLPDASKAGVDVFINPFHPILMKWDEIIVTLEKEIVPMLAKGCEPKALAGPASRLRASVESLALTASQVLGFVPGPIGIVASIINAIVCFSVGNIAGGLFELLGIVPLGKVAGKVSSRLVSKAGDIVNEVVQSNRHLKSLLETGSKASNKLFKKKLDEPGVGYQYGPRVPVQPQQSIFSQSQLGGSSSRIIEEQREHWNFIQSEYWKYIHLNRTYNILPKNSL